MRALKFDGRGPVKKKQKQDAFQKEQWSLQEVLKYIMFSCMELVQDGWENSRHLALLLLFFFIDETTEKKV